MSKPSLFVCLIGPKQLILYQPEDGKTLVESALFTTDDDGVAAFDQLLEREKNSIFHFLLDLPEETFVNEIVPSLNPHDQRLFAKRKLNQLFPRSPYRRYRWSKSTESGKKIFLAAGLNDPAIVDFWFERLERYEIRLASIDTTPLLAHALLNRLKLPFPRLVLVHSATQEGIRFTYLYDNNIAFSRISYRQEGESYTEMLTRENSRLFDYLVSVRLLGGNERLALMVLTDELLRSDDIEYVTVNERTDLLSLNITEAAQHANIPVDIQREQSADMFINLSIMRAKRNHYARTMHRRFYWLCRIQHSVKQGIWAALLFLFGGLALEFYWQYQADEIHSLQEDMIRNTLIRADRIKPTIRPHDPSAEDQAALVQNVQQIRHNWPTISPSLQVVEHILRLMPGFRLNRTEWRVIEAHPTSDSPPTQPSLSFSLAHPLAVEVLIELGITRPDLPYRLLLSWVEAMQERLKLHKIDTKILHAPLDIAQVGTLSAEANKPLPPEAHFILQLRFPPSPPLPPETHSTP